MQSFREFIDTHWRTPEVLAIELGLSVPQVRHWKTRDNIPAEFWLRVINAATCTTRGRDALLRSFAELAERSEQKSKPKAKRTVRKNGREHALTP